MNIFIITGKNFKNDGNQKIIIADKANFSFDFGLILAISRRFLPLCIVFSPDNDGKMDVFSFVAFSSGFVDSCWILQFYIQGRPTQ